MKQQLLLLVCLFALSSALAARRPSRQASGLSSFSRINNYGLTAREDDFDYCDPYGWCWECDRDKRCRSDEDCDDDDDVVYGDEDDEGYIKNCIRGYCCEFEFVRCDRERDCYDDDDDDDHDDD